MDSPLDAEYSVGHSAGAEVGGSVLVVTPLANPVTVSPTATLQPCEESHPDAQQTAVTAAVGPWDAAYPSQVIGMETYDSTRIASGFWSHEGQTFSLELTQTDLIVRDLGTFHVTRVLQLHPQAQAMVAQAQIEADRQRILRDDQAHPGMYHRHLTMLGDPRIVFAVGVNLAFMVIAGIGPLGGRTMGGIAAIHKDAIAGAIAAPGITLNVIHFPDEPQESKTLRTQTVFTGIRVGGLGSGRATALQISPLGSYLVVVTLEEIGVYSAMEFYNQTKRPSKLSPINIFRTSTSISAFWIRFDCCDFPAPIIIGSSTGTVTVWNPRDGGIVRHADLTPFGSVHNGLRLIAANNARSGIHMNSGQTYTELISDGSRQRPSGQLHPKGVKDAKNSPRASSSMSSSFARIDKDRLSSSVPETERMKDSRRDVLVTMKDSHSTPEDSCPTSSESSKVGDNIFENPLLPAGRSRASVPAAPERSEGDVPVVGKLTEAQVMDEDGDARVDTASVSGGVGTEDKNHETLVVAEVTGTVHKEAIPNGLDPSNAAVVESDALAPEGGEQATAKWQPDSVAENLAEVALPGVTLPEESTVVSIAAVEGGLQLLAISLASGLTYFFSLVDFLCPASELPRVQPLEIRRLVGEAEEANENDIGKDEAPELRAMQIVWIPSPPPTSSSVPPLHICWALYAPIVPVSQSKPGQQPICVAGVRLSCFVFGPVADYVRETAALGGLSDGLGIGPCQWRSARPVCSVNVDGVVWGVYPSDSGRFQRSTEFEDNHPSAFAAQLTTKIGPILAPYKQQMARLLEEAMEQNRHRIDELERRQATLVEIAATQVLASRVKATYAAMAVAAAQYPLPRDVGTFSMPPRSQTEADTYQKLDSLAAGRIFPAEAIDSLRQGLDKIDLSAAVATALGHGSAAELAATAQRRFGPSHQQLNAFPRWASHQLTRMHKPTASFPFVDTEAGELGSPQAMLTFVRHPMLGWIQAPNPAQGEEAFLEAQRAAEQALWVRMGDDVHRFRRKRRHAAAVAESGFASDNFGDRRWRRDDDDDDADGSKHVCETRRQYDHRDGLGKRGRTSEKIKPSAPFTCDPAGADQGAANKDEWRPQNTSMEYTDNGVSPGPDGMDRSFETTERGPRRRPLEESCGSNSCPKSRHQRPARKSTCVDRYNGAHIRTSCNEQSSHALSLQKVTMSSAKTERHSGAIAEEASRGLTSPSKHRKTPTPIAPLEVSSRRTSIPQRPRKWSTMAVANAVVSINGFSSPAVEQGLQETGKGLRQDLRSFVKNVEGGQSPQRGAHDEQETEHRFSPMSYQSLDGASLSTTSSGYTANACRQTPSCFFTPSHGPLTKLWRLKRMSRMVERRGLRHNGAT